MWKWVGVTILAAGVAMTLGCSQQPSGTAVMIEDKLHGDAGLGDGEGRDRDG